MKRCLSCTKTYTPSAPRETGEETCPHCNLAIPRAHGMPLYAPDMTDSGEGFKAEFFENLMRMEEHNFWFRARNKILTWAFGKYAVPFDTMLEVGCGTGFVLSGLKNAFPKARFSGSEIFLNGLRFAAQRMPDVDLMQMDARHIPYVDHFDAVGAFDVLEHIEEDEVVLAQLFAALKPGGTLILSVPQHAWLWSVLDDYACHARRYSAADLHRKFETVGFEIARSTSFVSFLLPAMMVSRFMKRNETIADVDTSAELDMNPMLNGLFYGILRFELLCIRLGINFPMGGSRLVIAHKPGGFSERE